MSKIDKFLDKQAADKKNNHNPNKAGEPTMLGRAWRKFRNRVVIPTGIVVTTVAAGATYLYTNHSDEIKDFVSNREDLAHLQEHKYLSFLFEEAAYTYPNIPVGSRMKQEMPAYVNKRLDLYTQNGGGLERDFAHVLVAQESSGKATIENEFTGACGLTQLLPSTQLELMYKYGEKLGYEALSKHIEKVSYKDSSGATRIKYDISDKKLRQRVLDICKDGFFSLEIIEAFTEDNKAMMSKHFPDRARSYTDLYFYHFLGASGGKMFIENLEQDPNRSPVNDFPSWVINANKPTFLQSDGETPRSYGDIYGLYAERIGTKLIDEDKNKRDEHYATFTFITRLYDAELARWKDDLPAKEEQPIQAQKSVPKPGA